jgi:hypothetical protein
VIIGDEEIVWLVGMAFARSENFWTAVASGSPAPMLAAELVPCEGPARQCVIGYLELARVAHGAAVALALPAEAARGTAEMRVMQYDRRLSWGAADEPLTTRKLQPRFFQIFPNVELLERVLAGTCAVPKCGGRPTCGAKLQRLRLPRCICCPTHENTDGDLYRRRVATLLASAHAIISRAEAHGARALALPVPRPTQSDPESDRKNP